jgi:hypothetical protein
MRNSKVAARNTRQENSVKDHTTQTAKELAGRY